MQKEKCLEEILMTLILAVAIRLSEDTEQLSILPQMPKLSLKNPSPKNKKQYLDSQPLEETTPHFELLTTSKGLLPQAPKLSLKYPLPKNKKQYSDSHTLEETRQHSESLITNNEKSPENQPDKSRKIAEQCESWCCKEVLKKLEMNKKMLSVKANMLQIREDLQQILNNKPADCNHTELENLNKMFSFPFETEENLQELEEYLSSKENFGTAVACMKKIGGKDEYEFIKRCMSDMNDNLAKMYAYDGTKEKKAFKSLKLNNVIEVALHSSFNTDKKIYESCMRKYLRRARERSVKLNKRH